VVRVGLPSICVAGVRGLVPAATGFGCVTPFGAGFGHLGDGLLTFHEIELMFDIWA
jgi:hypothetical protein